MLATVVVEQACSYNGCSILGFWGDPGVHWHSSWSPVKSYIMDTSDLCFAMGCCSNFSSLSSCLAFSVVTINLRHNLLKYGSSPQKLDFSHFVIACVLRISFTASLVTFINTQGTNVQAADNQESRFFYLTWSLVTEPDKANNRRNPAQNKSKESETSWCCSGSYWVASILPTKHTDLKHHCI